MRRRVLFWTATAGFGLGGQFDGILLHRILRWHHLMTDAAPQASDLTQAGWDAIFDTVMLALVVTGLTALLVHRPALVVMPARALVGAAALGFGLWHVADAVVIHWLLDWHRIRPSAPNPLVWDLVWLGHFGLLPLIAALVMLRRKAVALPDPAPRPAGAARTADSGTAAALRRSTGTRRHRKGPPHAP